jgi:DNA-binding NarL/FixJ family response regulator
VRTTAIPTLDECYYHLEKGNFPDFLIVDYLVITREPKAFLERVERYNRNIKIIFFTAHEDPILAELLIENGAYDYILKSGPELSGLTELQKNLRYIVANTERIEL